MVEYTYDSWGKIVSAAGSLITTLGTDQPFRYRGYVYDTETQLYYLQSRYYDPATCRFISADVLLSTGQGVIGHNSFAYCGDNPVARIDSEGNFWNLIVGTVIGAIAGGVTAAINHENVWAGIGIGAAVGFVAGATLGAGLAVAAAGTTAATVGGAAIAFAGGAAASAGGEVARQLINHDTDNGKINYRKVAKESVIGGVANLASFGMAKLIAPAFKAIEPVSRAPGKIAVGKTMWKFFTKSCANEKVISAFISGNIIAPLQTSFSMMFDR